jgi:hypothetical protein
MIPKQFRQPVEIADRKARFAALNQFVTKRQGWLTSIPGEGVVTLDCLEGSTLPDQLKRLGYDVRETGAGERILATAIVEKFTTRADGKFEPLVEGSTKPTARRDACGHLQGEAVRLRPALTDGLLNVRCWGEQRKTSARRGYFAF